MKNVIKILNPQVDGLKPADKKPLIKATIKNKTEEELNSSLHEKRNRKFETINLNEKDINYIYKNLL